MKSLMMVGLINYIIQNEKKNGYLKIIKRIKYENKNY